MPELTAAHARFFAFARERHAIHLRRKAGQPWPWTDDPILRKYRFTNVFRELDRTTVWFRENVRERMRDRPEVLLATVLFRWFNRIEIGDLIFCKPPHPNFLEGDPRAWPTPWDQFRTTGSVAAIRGSLIATFPKGPYVTGAYMLRSPEGMGKLDGILSLCSAFWRGDGKEYWSGVGESMALTRQWTTEEFTRWLRGIPGQGPFTAYEVACDLQHTDLLCNAPDVMTWANPGPGAQRGLNRLAGRVHPNPRKPKYVHRTPIGADVALAEMRELLRLSQDPGFWDPTWGAWDMRTVEHTLCEFDKHERVRLGEGEPKQLYREVVS